MLDSTDLAAAFETVVPDRKSATMKSRRSGSQQATFVSYSISDVRLKRLTKEQALILGADLSDRYRALQVWQQHLTAVSAPEPKVADVWVVEGTEYVVDRMLERKMMGETYNLLVRKTE